jgi:2-(1,2-epoxy-1,2-dihydrophenyl)acetyl-CoA isomerase
MEILNRTDEAAVAVLTLNRPDSRNALTTELLRALADELHAIQDSPHVRAVLLAGAGGTFCAGADLKEFATEPSPQGSLRRVRLVSQVVAQLRNLEQPTVAVVHGAAYGAGWGLALACDLTFASSTARFSLPEVRKGLRLPVAITNRLVEVVGPVRAAEIALGGERYGPEQGVAAGWVARVFSGDQASTDHASTFAREVASRPRASVANVKQVLRRGAHHELTPPPDYAWNEE